MEVILPGDHMATVQRVVEVGSKHDIVPAPIHRQEMVGEIALDWDQVLPAENATRKRVLVRFSYITFHIWFSLTWQDGHIGRPNNRIWFATESKSDVLVHQDGRRDVTWKQFIVGNTLGQITPRWRPLNTHTLIIWIMISVWSVYTFSFSILK